MAKTTKVAKPGTMMAQAGNMKLAGPARPGGLMAQAGNMKLAGPVKPAKPAKKTSAKKKA
jgi:hypothetical protein